MARAWEQLLAVSLRGTGRLPAPQQLDTALAPFAGASSESEEARLLRMAAATAPYETAGRRASVPAKAGEAPTCTQRPCSPGAASVLSTILREAGNQRLVHQWCQLAAKAGIRVPAVHLPRLFEVLEGGALHDDDVRAAVGARGRWLASLHPTWSELFEAQDDAERVFELGAIGQRVEALARLRAQDPDRARERLEAGWSDETTKDRVSLLTAFADNVVSADEAFLEAALDDRRAEVRRAAGELASRLPNSAFGARMAQRARACLRIAEEKKLLRKKQVLQVDLPEKLDKSMRRDGISGRQHTGLGKGASLLVEVLRFTPLATWSTQDPDAWITRASQTDWKDAVLRGLTEATLVQRDKTWALALGLALQKTGVTWAGEYRHALTGMLDERDRERVTLTLDKSQWGIRLGVDACDHLWSLPFTQELLRITKGWAGTLLLDSVCAHPDVVDAVRSVDESKMTGGAAEHHRELIRVLELRAIMRKELSP